MRRLVSILIMIGVGLVSACGVNILGVPREFRNVDLLTGTWQGEAAGVRITLVMDTAWCKFGCRSSGSGAWQTVASGDTGSFFVASGYDVELVGDAFGTYNMDFGLADDSFSVVFYYQMPDSSHLTGRVSATDWQADSSLRPLFPEDSSFAITLSKKR